MERKEIEKNSISLVKGRFGKPDLNRIELEGHTYMIKDARKRNFFFRWTLGWWLIQKEWKIYAKLNGIKGIPRPLKRIDRFAFALEFIPGRPIERNETLPPSFFFNLKRILDEIHRRGVAHLDLRHKGNVLVTEKGEPFLIDFNSSISLRVGGLFYRYFFPLLQWVDYGGFLKLKERVSPSSMSPEETLSLKRFNLIRKLWIFN